jgi:2-polyprenyl-6-hydroxyphenyl methylase / 3-demethylubiquinone-9 3-methyltransferase
MRALLVVPLALQAVAMAVDEGWFHRRRGLPRWERIGHPLDTLTIALCLGWLLIAGPDAVYVALAVGSTLFVTKDEWVHARHCSPGEQWLHAVLFALHPVVLAMFALLWWQGATTILAVQLALVLAFGVYQVVYWNRPRAAVRADIDNTWYGPLGERWYAAEDTPIALLRAEARHRNPWIAEQLAQAFGDRPCRVLDLGCGAGFLANDLAARGHDVVGVDDTPENLEVARAHDPTGRARYVLGDVTRLDVPEASFDAAFALDLLEHVEDPERVIAEASRALAPGGLFFFHTFNRTWQANLIVIKGVEWFVRNTPEHLHVLRLFRPPGEVAELCHRHGLAVAELHGSRPRFGWPLWRMLATGRVGDDFAFTFTRSTKLGYTGYARKTDAVARDLA